MLAVTMAYCLLWNVPFRTSGLIGEMLLTQNYIGSIWGHTWSLAVEEHFYIFLPIVLLMMMKRRKGEADPFRMIPWLFLGIASLCLLLRILNSLPEREFSHRAFFQPSHLRIDSLLCGVFLSYLHNFRPEILRRAMSDPWRLPISVVSVLGLIPAFVLPIENPIVYTIGFTLVYISFGTMLLLSLYKETNRQRGEPGRVARGIARIGVYSYPLYLWHVPMAQIFVTQASRFQVNQYLWHAIYFAASMAVGIAASKLVELPILRMRERIVPLANSSEPQPEFASAS
jgi:peptidoglycan/LPS O-acetylase OafA/YrhL